MNIELEVLAHRHLYYTGEPVLEDYEYDRLEDRARATLPEASPAHGIGGPSDQIEVLDRAREIKSMTRIQLAAYIEKIIQP